MSRKESADGSPRVRAFLLAFLIVSWASSFASATSDGEIRARGVLRVGMSGDYAPFCVCPESNDDCFGFEVDAARRLAADLGVELQIVRFQWPDLRRDFQEEKFDLVMSGITMRPERLLFAVFSRPYAVAGAVVLVADKDRFPSVTAINQAGVRLAVNAGGHLEQVARTVFGHATILPIAKNMALPDVVKNQQAEALLTDSFEAPQFLAKYTKLSALPAFGRDRKAYLLHRSDEKFQEWLDAWFHDREADDFLPGLRRRWLRGNTIQSLVPLTEIFALLDLRLALMPAVADYKRRFSFPVEDPTQEASVLESISTLARERGQDPEALQELFRVQIDLAKEVQQFILDNPQRLPVWARGLHLHSELRPVLSSLNGQIIDAVARVPSLSLSQDELVRRTEEEIVTEGVTTTGKQHLGKAMWRAIAEKARQFPAH